MSTLTATTRLGTYLTTKVGKLTTTVNYNLRKQGRKQTENNREEVYNYVKTGEQKREYGTNSTAAILHFGNISASYEIDSLNLLTASTTFLAIKPMPTHNSRMNDGTRTAS